MGNRINCCCCPKDNIQERVIEFHRLNEYDPLLELHIIDYEEEKQDNQTENNNLSVCALENIEDLTSEKKDCRICLDSFQKLDKVVFLGCIHMFHEKCIKEWLKTNNYCPICKLEVNI